MAPSGPIDHATAIALAAKLHEAAIQRQRNRQLTRRLSACMKSMIDGLWSSAMLAPVGEGKQACILDPHSRLISWWECLLVIAAIYSTSFIPLTIIFRQARWKHSEDLGILLDFLFTLDMLIRFRTAYRDHGYDVTQPAAIAKNYLRSWFLADLLSSIPIDRILRRSLTSTTVMNGSSAMRLQPITAIEVLGLLRIMRVGRLMRKLSSLTGANFLRIVYLMYMFLLFGHWLGLLWYAIAIRPIEASAEYDTLQPWVWTFEEDELYFVAVRYVCSLYWALSVMTNLKGPGAHETRQCLVHSPLDSFVVNPLGERVYTIFVFIIGCVLFSCIYGNINQFIQNLYASGLRYRKRMEELDEFAKFHRLSPQLRCKIRNYVDFQWSVTKGINIDIIAAGLPAHLQIEMRLQLNKRLVEQVSIFSGCPREFYEALVSKLQPCICVAGDFVFYESETGSRMYFIKRGVAQVGKGATVFATFREGDYFGELALLTDQPRTASVIAVTDLMLLSLSCVDLEAVLAVFPVARMRIEAAANDRLKALARSDANAVATKLYLRSPCAGAAQAAQGLGGFRRFSRPQSRSNSLSVANQLASGASQARARRFSHRLLTMPSKVAPEPDLALTREGRSNQAVEIRRRHADMPMRRPSLDSREKPEDELGKATADSVLTMIPSGPQLSSRRASIDPPNHSSRRGSTSSGETKQTHRLAGRRVSIGALPEEVTAQQAPSSVGAEGRRHSQSMAPTLAYSPDDSLSSEFTSEGQTIISHSQSRRGSILPILRGKRGAKVNVATVASGAEEASFVASDTQLSRRCSCANPRNRDDGPNFVSRRRSVDAGLSNAEKLPPCGKSITLPGVPVRIPATWGHLGASGSSKGAKSGHASPLRLSLDRPTPCGDPDELGWRQVRGCNGSQPFDCDGCVMADGYQSSGEVRSQGASVPSSLSSADETCNEWSVQTAAEAHMSVQSFESTQVPQSSVIDTLTTEQAVPVSLPSEGCSGSVKNNGFVQRPQSTASVAIFATSKLHDTRTNPATTRAQLEERKNGGALTATMRGWGSSRVAAKFATRVSLASRRASLRERRRSQPGEPPLQACSDSPAYTNVQQLSIEELSAHVKKIEMLIAPLQQLLPKFFEQRESEIAMSRAMWSEIKQISRRLSHVDALSSYSTVAATS